MNLTTWREGRACEIQQEPEVFAVAIYSYQEDTCRGGEKDRQTNSWEGLLGVM